MFPNPAATILHLESNVISKDDVQIEIYDVLGKKVYFEKLTTNGTISISINITGFKSGIYSVRMICGNEQVVKKIIIE